jgi:hypothetical protein
MLFEVDSFHVAKNIDYVIPQYRYHDQILVVLLPKNDTPFREMVHGNDWKSVQSFYLIGFDESTIKRYKSLNAIIISLSPVDITIIDLSGYAMLELQCEYREAVEYLEYLLQETY